MYPIKQFFSLMNQRFIQPIPLVFKKAIFAAYAVLLSAQSLTSLSPVLLERTAMALIVVHFIMEFYYPSGKNGDDGPPVKPLLWLLIAGTVALSGCKDSYIKARFGKQAKDSVTIHVAVTDTVRIPKDSIVTSYNTIHDTTFHRVYETHRTELIIDHKKGGVTTVKAECKPDTIIQTKEIKAKCPPAIVFNTGVSVWYKYGFMLATIGMIVVAAFFLLKMYEVVLPTVKPRNGNDIGFKNPAE